MASSERGGAEKQERYPRHPTVGEEYVSVWRLMDSRVLLLTYLIRKKSPLYGRRRLDTPSKSSSRDRKRHSMLLFRSIDGLCVFCGPVGPVGLPPKDGVTNGDSAIHCSCFQHAAAEVSAVPYLICGRPSRPKSNVRLITSIPAPCTGSGQIHKAAACGKQGSGRTHTSGGNDWTAGYCAFFIWFFLGCS